MKNVFYFIEKALFVLKIFKFCPSIFGHLGKSPDKKTKVKVALSSLKQFLATERPLKMMKNAFYFTLKALLVLKIFEFLS